MGSGVGGLVEAVSMLALIWRTGQSVDVPVPEVVEEEAVGEVGFSGTPRDVATGETDLKGEKLEIVGVYFRRWTWTNMSTTMARLRRKFA